MIRAREIGNIQKIDVAVPFRRKAGHVGGAGDPILEVRLFHQVEITSFAVDGPHEDDRHVGPHGADTVDKRKQPRFDLLGLRIRETVEDERFGIGAAEDVGEDRLEFGVAADAEIDELQSRAALQLSRIGHPCAAGA